MGAGDRHERRHQPDPELLEHRRPDRTPVGGQAFAVDLGLDSPAAAVMIAVDRATGPGHAWVGSCTTLVDGEPPMSNVNYVPGKATANLAIVATGEDETCVYVHTDAHLIIDLQAELVDERSVGMRPVDPRRVHDNRRTGQIGDEPTQDDAG